MIDAVVSWVDGSDPVHIAKRKRYAEGEVYHPDAVGKTRFASSGELRFAVLSLLKFCPFVQTVHVVTDAQHPTPLDPLLEDEAMASRIRIVDHKNLFGEHSDLLPVFSSRSIETMIHRIPGLAEHFLYLNDDMAIGRPMAETDFFEAGLPILRGRLRRFPNPGLARLKALVRPSRPGYKAAQMAAARSLGRKRDWLLLEHQPQPMRRSTLASYFEHTPEALRAQARHRFRSEQQVSPIALTVHLEMQDGAPVRPPVDVGYVRPGRPTGSKLEKVMDALQADAFASFCVQSVDKMSDEDRRIVIDGLERRFDA